VQAALLGGFSDQTTKDRVGAFVGAPFHLILKKASTARNSGNSSARALAHKRGAHGRIFARPYAPRTQ